MARGRSKGMVIERTVSRLVNTELGYADEVSMREWFVAREAGQIMTYLGYVRDGRPRPADVGCLLDMHRHLGFLIRDLEEAQKEKAEKEGA